MNLTAEELRVLCVLVEKSFTTPDQYPMTTNALVMGCNQRTSRDPVVSYTAGEVDATLQNLRAAGWARTVRTTGSRTNKHKHVFAEQLPVSDGQLALLAVLGLRGAQSPGELKTRTERYIAFDSFSDVVSELEAMAAMPDPLVRNIGTTSGQSQDRWIHLLTNAVQVPPETPTGPGESQNQVRSSSQNQSITQTERERPATRSEDTVLTLQRQVADLERRMEDLENLVLSLSDANAVAN